MEKKQWNENWEVGQIVATDYATARVFAGYGIDFCCHGEVALEKACEQAGVSVAEVLKALDALEPNKEVAGGFAAWRCWRKWRLCMERHIRNCMSCMCCL